MKLAKALIERSDLQSRLSQIKTRLNNNAKVQEGEVPEENPLELLAEKDRIISELEKIIARINLTNSKTECEGVTITEMLAKRECMQSNISIMRSFLENASAKVTRYSKTEIIIKSTVNVAEFQKQVDQLSKELRELDEKIQELNWATELL